MALHRKCRFPTSEPYSASAGGVRRLAVPDEAVPWSAPWPGGSSGSAYAPPDFTHPGVVGKPWADPPADADGFAPRWNCLDGGVDRRSHDGAYEAEAEAGGRPGRPLNPQGRTGLRGRGLLGRWGPNHAADPIVTRWRPGGSGQGGQGGEGGEGGEGGPCGARVLQFVAIKRRDTGEWALPGGMVDPGEQVSATLRREFLEEALASLQDPVRESAVNAMFAAGGDVIYKGYVDDPRNTDNAWMETVAAHFHDEEGDGVGSVPLQAGDDAVSVRWADLSADLELYASHSKFLKAVADKMGIPWTTATTATTAV